MNKQLLCYILIRTVIVLTGLIHMYYHSIKYFASKKKDSFEVKSWINAEYLFTWTGVSYRKSTKGVVFDTKFWNYWYIYVFIHQLITKYWNVHFSAYEPCFPTKKFKNGHIQTIWLFSIYRKWKPKYILKTNIYRYFLILILFVDDLKQLNSWPKNCGL